MQHEKNIWSGKLGSLEIEVMSYLIGLGTCLVPLIGMLGLYLIAIAVTNRGKQQEEEAMAALAKSILD